MVLIERINGMNVREYEKPSKDQDETVAVCM
jgi:hypothetical protein